MATTTKKSSKNTKAKSRRLVVKTSLSKRARTNAELRHELAESLQRENALASENVRLSEGLDQRNAELREALEHQTATAETLGVIASSPIEIQPVLDTIAENAARVCGIDDVLLRLIENESMIPRAHFGSMPIRRVEISIEDEPQFRWMREHGTLYIPDVRAQTDFPILGSGSGFRTFLGAPLRQHGKFVGALLARRSEVRPFTSAQIKLLETFADQAVIAIENVRLFKELENRNHELTEALEQQTATSEVLRVIAGSPTELQSVLDAVTESAVRLASAKRGHIRQYDGEVLRLVASYGESPEQLAVFQTPVRPRVESRSGRAFLERRPIHDLDAQVERHPMAAQTGARTALAVPLLREDTPIGVFTIWRDLVQPFTDRQIELVKTFADQAVVAIENVRLFKELQQRNRDLTEALEQQTATSEILTVIASSPTDIQPVLDTVIANAVTLAGAKHGHIRQLDGEFLRLVAHYNESPEYIAHLQANPVRVAQSLAGRAFLEGKPVQHLAGREEPGPSYGWSGLGDRTLLAVPLLKKGTPIGNILIWRDVVEPFTERQIELVKTFADQAVIAIENVRLFKELQERNAELREALEHQTATAEVLGIISRSPTDVQPVLDAIVESAARVCAIDDVLLRVVENECMIPRAHFGPMPTRRIEIRIDDEPQFRWIGEHGTLYIPDLRAQTDFPSLGSGSGFLSFLGAPLRQHGKFIGALLARRTEVRPFTPAQIKLLETFADQAVIAIENARLFQELQERNRDLTEALEQQTATAEILRVISSSPTDLQPVFEAIVGSAARLCDATFAALHRFDGQVITFDAHHGMTEPEVQHSRSRFPRPPDRDIAVGRAILDRKIAHIHDIRRDPEYHFRAGQLTFRTVLAVPLLRESTPVGAMGLWRREVQPFTDKQIELVNMFANQAVIAIENVRLFKELQDRNRDLTEALEQQTATSEVLKVISRSTFDLQPVLDTLIENATRLCGAKQGRVFRFDGEVLRAVADYGSLPEHTDYWQNNVIRPGDATVTGKAVQERRPIHIVDVLADPEYQSSEGLRRGRVRTIFAVPMLRENALIGAIAIWRTEPEPFTDKQIELVTTFADQAVIAIENVRLFKELQERNRDLSETLEQQTATSEVLRVIASSPTELQPVLDTLIANAVRLSGAIKGHVRQFDGEFHRVVAHYGETAEMIAILRANPLPASPELPAARAHVGGKTIHILDVQAESGVHLGLARQMGTRTMLAVPLLREETNIGSLTIWRDVVEPFTERQMELVKTFADQAVIAIENVRLFQELKESLEQQTATSEILGVIASSPTDIQPVLDVVAKNAARLCDSDDAQINSVEGDMVRKVAKYGVIAQGSGVGVRPLRRGSLSGYAILNREVIHIDDMMAAREEDYSDVWRADQQIGIRSALAVPLLREGVAIGAITIRRLEVRPFTDKQIALLKTFADQAVIAIENVRLFRELQERNSELREALEHQTATAEVLGIISRSPTDVQPVLDAIVESAARVCGIDDVLLRLHEKNVMTPRAHIGPIPIGRVEISIDEPQVRWMREHGTLHVPDVHAQNDFPMLGSASGYHTHLSVPLRQHGELIGLLTARRNQIRPFTPAQIKLLETFADQAVIAIENVRLFKELDERTNELTRSVGELKALGEVGQAVSSTLDLENVLATIVAHAVQLSGTDCGVIYEYDESTQEFHLRASHRMEEEVLDALRAAPIRLGEGVTGQAVTTRAPVQVPDILDQREYTGTRVRPMLTRLGYRSLLSIPLFREQQIMGGLTVWRRQSGNFEPEIVNLLQTFATQSALAIQNARLFREIEDKGREIETANRHKSEFLANMSHELRTPLTAIIGFSEVLSEKLFGELNDKQNEYMDDIVSSGRHLLSLINDILDLSKVEAGRMELDLTKFDLPTAIENALILIQERATRHGIRLQHTVDERLGEVLGDERKFKQILLNLLSNAVKFTAEVDVSTSMLR